MEGRRAWSAAAVLSVTVFSVLGRPASADDSFKLPPIQSCIPANLHPVYDLCQDVVGNRSISVQASVNLTILEEMVGKTFRSLIYVRDSVCRQNIVNFACGIYYPLCVEEDQQLRCPCPAIVPTLLKNCSIDFYGHMLAQTATQLLTNLTADHRPCGNLTLKRPGLGSCFMPSGATGKIQCPVEMVQPDTPGARNVYIAKDNGPDWPFDGADGWQGGEIEACRLPCNPRIFSEGEAHASVVLVTTLAWVSTVCSLALFVIFHVSSGKELHAWPERLQVYFTTCVFFLSLSLTFASFIGYSDSMWCENQTLCTVQVNTTSPDKGRMTEPVRLQAMMLEYFGLALAMWWLLICFNLFLSIVVYRKDGSTNEEIQSDTQWWEKFYHAFAWGIPGILTMYLFVEKKLGYPAYGNPSYCWIKDDDSSLWEFSFYFIETLVFVVIGMVFFGAILQKLRSLTSAEYSLWKLIRNVSMVITFIFAFAFTFTFMGIYQITLTGQEDADKAAYNEYIQCVIKRWWKSSFPGEFPPNCRLDNHPDLVFMDIQSACFASMGIVTFFVFGSPHSATIAKQIRGQWRKCCGGTEQKGEEIKRSSRSDMSQTLIDEHYRTSEPGSSNELGGAHRDNRLNV